MSISDKLDYLVDTKQIIKSSINQKGVTVDDSIPFRDYATMINEIQDNSNATSEPIPETIISRDIEGRAQVENPIEAQDIATKSYVDNIPLADKISSQDNNRLTISVEDQKYFVADPGDTAWPTHVWTVDPYRYNNFIVDPIDKDKVYIKLFTTSNNTLAYISTNQGTNLTGKTIPYASKTFNGMGQNGDILYFNNASGPHYSLDNGTTWTVIPNGTSLLPGYNQGPLKFETIMFDTTTVSLPYQHININTAISGSNQGIFTTNRTNWYYILTPSYMIKYWFDGESTIYGIATNGVMYKLLKSSLTATNLSTSAWIVVGQLPLGIIDVARTVINTDINKEHNQLVLKLHTMSSDSVFKIQNNMIIEQNSDKFDVIAINTPFMQVDNVYNPVNFDIDVAANGNYMCSPTFGVLHIPQTDIFYKFSQDKGKTYKIYSVPYNVYSHANPQNYKVYMGSSKLKIYYEGNYNSITCDYKG